MAADAAVGDALEGECDGGDAADAAEEVRVGCDNTAEDEVEDDAGRVLGTDAGEEDGGERGGTKGITLNSDDTAAVDAGGKVVCATTIASC